jgi:23S rRNA pseudouridine1911/1915/1917 synthase
MLRKVIAAGGATVEGGRAKVAYRLKSGQRVEIVLPELPASAPLPEDIPLEILYEDEHVAAINKPPGMVVHPARGHWSGTLASALSFRYANLSSVGGTARPGIVHRLDRDTSGVIVVAKTDQAHFLLARQFERRTTEKEYLAIVCHVPDRDRDVIDQPIGLHATHREKMAIARHAPARSAQTFYEVLERFDGFALVRVVPKTGRTHQIRVHLAHIGCPVLCDRLYGSRASITRGELTRRGDDDTVILSRQALHAHRLKLAHPITNEPLVVTAPLPPDMEAILAALRLAQ